MATESVQRKPLPFHWTNLVAMATEYFQRIRAPTSLYLLDVSEQQAASSAPARGGLAGEPGSRTPPCDNPGLPMDPGKKRQIRLFVALGAAVLLSAALVYTSFSAGTEARQPSEVLAAGPSGETYQITEIQQEEVKTPKDVSDRIAKLKSQGRKVALMMLASKSTGRVAGSPGTRTSTPVISVASVLESKTVALIALSRADSSRCAAWSIWRR